MTIGSGRSGVVENGGRFDPGAYDQFVLGAVEWSEASNTIAMHYHLRDGPTFTEELELDGTSLALSEPALCALESAIRVLHLCTSTSYYKTAAPGAVRVAEHELSSSEGELLAELLGPGLAELRYRNHLDPGTRPRIEARHREAAPPPTLEETGIALVPMGGGRDSLVTVDALCRYGHSPVLFVFGGHPRILEVCERTGLETVVMHRRMDPRLERLTERGALGGHVPVSAIVTAAALVAAVCVGADTVVMANERSASDPNLVVDGVAINHQYSKSLDFERVFRATIRDSVSRSIECFSLLRRASDVSIARRFARLTGYHDVFVSCNHAFAPAFGDERWCRACPKCRFVFLTLAPFLTRSELMDIFGGDLLDDELQVPGYLALLGVAGWVKPFDCVGEVADTRFALSLAADRPEWRDAKVVSAIRRAAPEAFVDASHHGVERPGGAHFIPSRLAACARTIG